MENQNDYIEKVRDSYTPRERTKLDELKKLDAKVKLLPTVVAYILGCAAALILGVGMCLAMKVIGASIMNDTVLMTVGVVIGVAGIALGVSNPFVYKSLLNKRKKKYGEKIVSLSDELLNKQ